MSGEELKQILLSSGIKLNDVAERLELSPQALSRRLSVKNVKIDFVEKLENAIGIEIPIRRCTSTKPSEGISVNTGDGRNETFLLPISAMAGSLTHFAEDGVMAANCERITSPIVGVDFAITIHGDSMAPEYPSGSQVLIKRIDPNLFIEWGKVYVLDTSNGVVVKELRKCDREGYVTCHSLNPDGRYADFDVPLSEVYGIYRVMMCMAAK